MPQIHLQTRVLALRALKDAKRDLVEAVLAEDGRFLPPSIKDAAEAVVRAAKIAARSREAR